MPPCLHATWGRDAVWRACCEPRRVTHDHPLEGTDMRTLLALLIANDGRPPMTHDELARLRGLSPRTVLREISEGRCPVPMWKDGSKWLC